jgi:hypothetical protein
MTNLREDVIRHVRFGLTLADAMELLQEEQYGYIRHISEIPSHRWTISDPAYSESIPAAVAQTRNWAAFPGEGRPAEIAEARRRWEASRDATPASEDVVRHSRDQWPDRQEDMERFDGLSYGSERINLATGNREIFGLGGWKPAAPAERTIGSLRGFAPDGTPVEMKPEDYPAPEPAADADSEYAETANELIGLIDRSIRGLVYDAIELLDEERTGDAVIRFEWMRELSAARDLVEKWGGE